MDVSSLVDALNPKVTSLSPLLIPGGPKVTGLSPFPAGGAKTAMVSPLIGGIVPKVASTSPLVDLSGQKITTGRFPKLGQLSNDWLGVAGQTRTGQKVEQRRVNPAIPERGLEGVLSVKEARDRLHAAQLHETKLFLLHSDFADQPLVRAELPSLEEAVDETMAAHDALREARAQARKNQPYVIHARVGDPVAANKPIQKVAAVKKGLARTPANPTEAKNVLRRSTGKSKAQMAQETRSLAPRVGK